jgi:hypothetical protein
MSCELIWEQQGFLFRYSGVATDDDLRRVNIEVLDDPRFDSQTYQIADFSNITKLEFSSEIIHWIAKSDSRAALRNPNIRVAVVGRQSLLLGLANMYRIYFDLNGGTWKQKQFAAMEQAHAWLDDNS